MFTKEFIVKDKKLVRIYAGEVYVTVEKGIVITTLLGSCVSVCLSDNINSVFGLNHFMLPQKNYKSKQENIYRYALPAVNKLIKLMIKQGADIRFMKAKIFGGAFVGRRGLQSIPEMNIKMAEKCLLSYEIEIKARDVGGVHGREIYFCTGGQIYTRILKPFKLNLN
ncbi:MAG: chemotaxis protein CheD [Firmicutes bacterium]|nr:chemotaxis protein CheD [Bacillota bacterium]